jgi:RES domain-containing protein
MAKRPTYPPNDAMTRQQLQQLERSLSLLSRHIVKEKYRQVVDRCRFLDLSTPRVMQELVTTWKVLWRWRK